MTYEIESMIETAPSTIESTADADEYDIPWQSINAGGAPTSSTNYQLNSSAGQSAIGYSTSTNYQMGGGYWYGMTTTSRGCFCGGAYPTFGDITCDQQTNPVDVVRYVNYVYKNITPFPCDPCG